MSSPEQSAISFSQEDIACFSRASGDRNPLHLSAEYARSTPYGQVVVFGCLGALACLGRLRVHKGAAIGWLQAEFLRPMFLGVTYRIDISGKDAELTARLLDGSAPVIVLKVKTDGVTGKDDGIQVTEGPACFEHEKAVVRPEKEIVTGLETTGSYHSDPADLAVLAERWGAVDLSMTAILCWASYAVGMELPGESALFSKLQVNVNETNHQLGKLDYRSTVESVDALLNLVRTGYSLSADSRTVASGQCWSYIRSALPRASEGDLPEAASESLAGRVTVLIGGSRGLGAALKRVLESRGAIVYSLSRSEAEADPARSVVGNASDTAALLRLRDLVLQEQGRMDYLISNACPPILPLRLEVNGIQRIQEYIDATVSIALTPLCAFLEVLNISGGCSVVISSTAVEEPVREWPHYAAAKQAVEMLARVGSMQYPRVRTLIVRPQKLLTALTNTPMGRRSAASPMLVASRIVDCLENPPEPGKTAVIHPGSGGLERDRLPSSVVES